MAAAGPLAPAPAMQAFQTMGEEFGIEAKMITWLTSPTGLGAMFLDDFLHSASTEQEVGKLAELAKPDNVILTTSRLRQAWRSLKRTRDDDDIIKKNGLEVADLDELLAQPVLDNLISIHYARYKMSWPPEVMPSDTTVSRMVRELDKRMLSVRDALKVRTQIQQQRGIRKRTRLGDGMEVIHNEVEDEEVMPSVYNYLQCLLTLLIAYSIAGCKLRADAPNTENRSTDSTKVVQCPLDTLMRYFYRVQDRSHRLGNTANALQWLRQHDEAERGCWVDRIRNSEETLGEIIHAVFATPEAMWEIPLTQPPPRIPEIKGLGKGGAPGGTTKVQNTVRDKAATDWTKGAGALKDGTELCLLYNKGLCKNAKCNRTHKCNVVKTSGRICGAFHPAKEHNNKW
jgi:hypothetical protein